MKMTDLRAKARSIFGSANPEPMPNQPNGAAALQKRANARPIPTYKVGGVVKKADGGKVPMATAAEKKVGDALMMTRRGKQIMDAQAKRDAERERMGMAKRALADKLLGIPARKDGGKVQTSSDTARKLAGEMGGMKKGGKAKDGLAVMIAIGKTKPVKEKATGEMYASKAAMKKHEAAESPAKQRAERKMDGGMAAARDVDYEGSKITRGMKSGGYCMGGKPVKKAAGGAAKVRKGMMTPTGDIKKVVKPKKNVGF